MKIFQKFFGKVPNAAECAKSANCHSEELILTPGFFKCQIGDIRGKFTKNMKDEYFNPRTYATQGFSPIIVVYFRKIILRKSPKLDKNDLYSKRNYENRLQN